MRLTFLLLSVLAVWPFSACRSLPCELRRADVADVIPPNPEKKIALLSDRTDPCTAAIADGLERTGWNLSTGTSFAQGEWALMKIDIQYGTDSAAPSEILVCLFENRGARRKDGMRSLVSFAGNCAPREYARRFVEAVNAAYERSQNADRKRSGQRISS